MQRGKSDQIDAQRIALYAYRNQDKAKADQDKDNIGNKLAADLLALPERLTKTRSQLLVPIKEMKEAGLAQQAKEVEKACKQTISVLNKDVTSIEKRLQE